MKILKSCPKCGSTDIVRIPDNPNRPCQRKINIYTSTYTLFGKNPCNTLCLLFMWICRKLG